MGLVESIIMVIKKEGILFVVSGPSGVGKGTVIKEALKLVPDVYLSISYTTRPPRENETNGKEYFFVTEDEFISMREKGEFLEWARVHSNLYGTPRRYVEQKLKLGEDVLLEIDTQGARRVKEIFPEGVFVFILPPSFDALIERLNKRGTEDHKSIEERYNNAKDECKQWKWYNYTIVNDSIAVSGKLIASIVMAERCKSSRLKEGSV
ncbi:MAG: guanylate kinase [bacterium]